MLRAVSGKLVILLVITGREFELLRENYGQFRKILKNDFLNFFICLCYKMYILLVLVIFLSSKFPASEHFLRSKTDLQHQNPVSRVRRLPQTICLLNFSKSHQPPKP